MKRMYFILIVGFTMEPRPMTLDGTCMPQPRRERMLETPGQTSTRESLMEVGLMTALGGQGKSHWVGIATQANSPKVKSQNSSYSMRSSVLQTARKWRPIWPTNGGLLHPCQARTPTNPPPLLAILVPSILTPPTFPTWFLVIPIITGWPLAARKTQTGQTPRPLLYRSASWMSVRVA